MEARSRSSKDTERVSMASSNSTQYSERQMLTTLQDYKKLGNSGLRISPLCLGTMTFGTKWKDLIGTCLKEDALAIFNKYTNLGGNFIDCANKFQEGQAEEWVGEFLEHRSSRDDLVISTKYSLPKPPGNVNFCGNHRKNMFFSLQQSLERLRTSYIDLYYVHFWDFSTPEVEIMRGLDDLVRSGKVLYVGICDTPAWEVARCNTIAEHFGWTPFIAYQGRHNIGYRSMEREIIPMSIKMGLGVIPWLILGGSKYIQETQANFSSHNLLNQVSDRDYAINQELGRIAQEIGRPINQVMMNWELQQPGVVSAIIGVKRMAHLEDSLMAMDFKLSSSHIQRLNQVSKFDLGFPLDLIGTSYETSEWVNWRG